MDKATLVSLGIVLILLLFSPANSGTVNLLPTTRCAKECEETVQCILNARKNETCSTIPVSPDAFDVEVERGGFQLQLLRKGVWYYYDGAYSTLMLKVYRRLALIDFPAATFPNDTRLIDAIKEVLNGTIPYRIDMVYSHAHLDHIGFSRQVFDFLRENYPKARILVWGTLEAYDIVQRSVTNRSVLPNIIVRKRGRTIRVSRYLKIRMDIVGGHTSSDLRIYIPPFRGEPGIVMYVDVVFPGYAAPFDFALSEDLGRYIQAQKDLLNLDFDILVPGHIALGDKKDVRKNIEYTEDVISAAQTGIASVTPQQFQDAGIGRVSDPNSPEFRNAVFPLLGVVRPLQTEACFRIVVEKWGCRLGAVDLVARGHCLAAITYVNIEL
ncbi:hypothetical protein BWQ96_03369 [Gracilariopsis chorda]|uniref:Metallo-beta-lactamase domain-containing protein n=1 Tax=Gracilariopsis chorda TaxID=448386 RepID=A0A2V3J0F1_9FLOR|nr:hypothetical protein BWQ96_03369 [Gracilariopsis chorda]|eukprot:PXF46840.1 hypothetical protein BWQ96_03369 [Gracilariopsis chorda]